MPGELKVVDASALGALLFGEPKARDVARRLGGARLSAPTLLRYEIASICLKKLERYPEQRAGLLEMLSHFERMDLRELPVPTGEIVALAESEKLTVYDAAYLWLAVALEAELVTLDSRLRKASRRRRGRQSKDHDE
jgi:predicted nucleic acid-binding protein